MLRLWQHRRVLLKQPTFEEDLENRNCLAVQNYVNSSLTAKALNTNCEIVHKLLKACCNKDLETIKNIIYQKEASVDDIVDSNGNTLLHIAALTGNLEAVEFLLQNGAKIVNNMENKSPSDLATQNRHYNLTKLFTMRQLIRSSDRPLIQSTRELTQDKNKPKKLPDKNSKPSPQQQITPLYRTCERERKEDGINLMKEEKQSIIHLSVNEDHQIFGEQFSSGANVETSKTPLYHVSSNARNTVVTAKKKDFEIVTRLELPHSPKGWLKDDFDIVKFELENIAKVDVTDETEEALPIESLDGQKFYSSTSESLTRNQMKRKSSHSSSLEEIEELSVKNFKPDDLHLACKEKREEDAIALIREDKTLICCLNKENETPLHVACRNGLNKVVRELISNGADIEARNKYEETPLYCASWNGHNEVVKFLLEKNADVNSKAKCGYTPLFRACFYEHLETIEILYDHGADVIIEDDDLYTPLHLACSQKNLKMVRFLVEKGAKINVLNVLRSTPLHIASEKGDLEIVKYLLENGAKVDVIDDKGRTPFHIAQHRQHMEIVKLILNYIDI